MTKKANGPVTGGPGGGGPGGGGPGGGHHGPTPGGPGGVLLYTYTSTGGSTRTGGDIEEERRRARQRLLDDQDVLSELERTNPDVVAQARARLEENAKATTSSAPTHTEEDKPRSGGGKKTRR